MLWVILNSRRGKIEGFNARRDAQVIKATVPLAEMFGYATTIRSMTQGRAIYSMQFSHYAEVPKSVADEIVEKTQSNKVSVININLEKRKQQGENQWQKKNLIEINHTLILVLLVTLIMVKQL